jgi:hypothetical protein
VTRAEFVQLIYNTLDLPAAHTNPPHFPDVAEGAWYYPAVLAASQSGLFNGLKLTDGQLQPHQAITRQEMAQIIANVARLAGVSPINNITAASFSDYADMDESYIAAIEQAVNAGFFNPEGMGERLFSPNSHTTRAQAATLQMNMLRNLNRFE